LRVAALAFYCWAIGFGSDLGRNKAPPFSYHFHNCQLPTIPNSLLVR
jgi:hypothetical protein